MVANLQVLQALHHPNVVSCKEAFVSGGKLCILMDYCSEGKLNSTIQRRLLHCLLLSCSSCMLCEVSNHMFYHMQLR